MNDELVMQYKGVDNLNLLQHTPFFIFSEGAEPEQVEKVTSTPDIFPTLLNLFGLSYNSSYCAGHDAFGPGGGYVFFADGSWLDADQYHEAALVPETQHEQETAGKFEQYISLSRQILSSDYFAALTE
jgi:phosphoglycerol transferase MdoB-like AlkP superfamily enzyme